MSNIRVHELAKQLGKDSKDILKVLAQHGIEAKTHMSSITEETAVLVKKELSPNAGGSENRKEEPAKSKEKPESGQKPVRKPEAKEAEKKSHITQVYNPQNSGNHNKQKQNKKNNNNGNNHKNGDGRSSNTNQAPKQNETKSNPKRDMKNENTKNTDNKNNVKNDGQSGNNRNNDRNNNNRNNDRNNNVRNNDNRNNDRNNNVRNNENRGTRTNQKGNNNHKNNGQKNNNNRNNVNKPQPVQETKEEIREITIPEYLTIKELADKMKIQPSVIVKKLFMQGQIVTINQEVDFETAQDIALQFEVIAEQEEKVDIIEELLREEEEDESKLVKRPPVVCVMGHVDHGKTSLLDAIRETNVIDREAGGITQHIGAYTVEVNGEKITFLDTPGHEAFTAMRMRGAQSTDIAILVVAADDGVMPQTVEAINHARAAGISIIVAVNKIDKPSANIDKVKQELAEYELVAEDWGGQTIFVPVSAHTKEGIELLLEMILLEAEVCELKANPNRKARGLVIEAKLDKGKGPVATVLVQKGTLRVGDAVAAGSFYGKVRAMSGDQRERVNEAGPSTPVEILGLNGVPNAGEVLVATKNEKEARNFAETFIKDGREKLLEGSKSKTRMSLDDLFSQIQAGELKELNIIVKADVQGSVEAVKQSLVKLSNEEVVVKAIHAGVGAINESDVILASASNAIIIGFNVRPDNMAKEIADRENVDLRLYRVIYQAIDDIEKAMKGLLDPVFEEKVIGHAEVRQIFKASGVGTIAGSYVLDGVFRRGCSCRITRDGEQLFDGPLASLKRFKDDVKEVKSNYECGLVFEKYNDVKEGDIVEAYVMEEVPR
ncbi:MAG: translation initiation factor IF-2 [Lachnospiraceae bacterium]|nr:translation initiation factor IF-2 [Lachnospiraceae bacterium]